MPYTLEQVLKFVDDHKSFFSSPLTHQNTFQAFFKTLDEGEFVPESSSFTAMQALEDYSNQLNQILRDNRIDWPGPIPAQIQAIYSWRDLWYWTDNNHRVNPVFNIEAVREFLMNNQAHPALKFWREYGGQVFIEHNGSLDTLTQSQSVVYTQQKHMFDDITNRARIALEKVGPAVLEQELWDAIMSDSVFHIKTGNIGKYLYGRTNYIDEKQTPSFCDVLLAYKTRTYAKPI